MRLTGRQKEIHQSSGGIAYPDDLGAKPASRATQRLRPGGTVAVESQTQTMGLLGRAPAAL